MIKGNYVLKEAWDIPMSKLNPFLLRWTLCGEVIYGRIRKWITAHLSETYAHSVWWFYQNTNLPGDDRPAHNDTVVASPGYQPTIFMRKALCGIPCAPHYGEDIIRKGFPRALKDYYVGTNVLSSGVWTRLWPSIFLRVLGCLQSIEGEDLVRGGRAAKNWPSQFS